MGPAVVKPSFWSRIDQFARSLTPFALTCLLILVATAPTHIPGAARVMPLLGLIAVYHWTVYRPELLPGVAVFMVGLLQDLLGGGAIGVYTLVYLAVYGGVLTQRAFFHNKPFFVIWLGFLLVGAGAMVATWVVVSIYYARPIGIQAFVFQYLMTMAFHPPLAWLLMRWQQFVLKEGD